MTDQHQRNLHVTVHKARKAWYKRLWVWAGIIFLFFAIGSALANTSTTTSTSNGKTTTKVQAAPQWDAATIYPQITTDMTKEQAEAVIGKTSNNCSETDSPGIGTMELCIYDGGFSGKGSITVDYLNGKVYSKSKSGF